MVNACTERIAKERIRCARHVRICDCLDCTLLREIDSVLAERDSAERVAVEFQAQLQFVECEWMRWANFPGIEVLTLHRLRPRLRSLQCKCLSCNRCGKPSHNLAEHGRGICGPCEICGKQDGKATHGSDFE